jgi:hypothetical protein
MLRAGGVRTAGGAERLGAPTTRGVLPPTAGRGAAVETGAGDIVLAVRGGFSGVLWMLRMRVACGRGVVSAAKARLLSLRAAV